MFPLDPFHLSTFSSAVYASMPSTVTHQYFIASYSLCFKFEVILTFLGATGQHNTPKKRLAEPVQVRVMAPKKIRGTSLPLVEFFLVTFLGI
jgi:hypothetical protein